MVLPKFGHGPMHGVVGRAARLFNDGLTIVLHPRQPIGRLFDRKDLPRVFFDTSPSTPQGLRFLHNGRALVCCQRLVLVILQSKAEVRGIGNAEKLFKTFELFAISMRNGDFDVDSWPELVAAFAIQRARKEIADLHRGQKLERQWDPIVRVIQDHMIDLPLIEPLGSVLQNLQHNGAHIVLGIKPW